MVAPSSRLAAFYRRLSLLGLAVPLFRPGASLPGANAPFQSAPVQGRGRAAPARSLRRTLRISIAEGMFAEVVTAFAGGAALTGWAVYLGSSPLTLGLLSSLPFLSQTLQIPAAFLSATYSTRLIAVWACSLARLVLLPLALLPFSGMSHEAQGELLVGVCVLSSALGVVGNNAWVAWMGDLVPERIRGRYFGQRTAMCTLAGTVAGLVAGVLMDQAGQRGLLGGALAILALVATLAGLVTGLLLRQQMPAPVVRPSGVTALSSALLAFRDERVRALLAYQLVWNLAIGVTGSYFPLHMHQDLGMGFALIAAHTALVAFVRVLLMPLWGRVLDRVGSRPVLIVCSFGIAAIPLYWLTASRGFLWPIALDIVVSAALWSGHGLASFALPLKVAPTHGKPFYLGSFAMVGGLGYAAATYVGGALLSQLPAQLMVGERMLIPMHVALVLSAFLRLLGAIVALRIAEDGARSLRALGGAQLSPE